ncbi:VWA domain-containing protein [Deinococcus roseus]|uniref:VWFA domain-containing protein n=1 Tax=Deinococcus roseus TaxID=392414 RepID=A0ABQ2D1V6_9DEIO|nr:VWA domain-containing protein [Deinococcus roseus]GGJ42449.1 hypothetical protein GCM10008938_30700 [Deinococcus roseus]
MSRLYPFSAIVGQQDMKLALILNAIDPSLGGVLLRGDKGSAKSTAARSLAQLLGEMPFVNLPLGVTEDRLLGGLDLEKTLQGQPTLKPGLLQQAHLGVLYVDEVNLLPDFAVDALLDVAASGVGHLEREGFSLDYPARFTLVGSMNLEEGELRPQLLDRFALSVEVEAPRDPEIRRQILESRMAFEMDPQGFMEKQQEQQESLKTSIQSARSRLLDVQIPDAVLQQIADLVCQHQVTSLRADLALLKAARAHAAWQDQQEITPEDIQQLLHLVLNHRTPEKISPPPTQNQEQPQQPENQQENPISRSQVFEPVLQTQAPDLQPVQARSSNMQAEASLRTQVRKTEQPAVLHLRSSLTHALTRGGNLHLTREDLHEAVPTSRPPHRVVFVVDASGSLGAQARMGAVKGALLKMLERQEEVALVTFRGQQAQVALPPTRNLEEARKVLSYLPTGGRTPLLHALQLGRQLLNRHSSLILITDGKANVGSWEDTLQAAKHWPCPAAVIGTDPAATSRTLELARAMNAHHQTLQHPDSENLLEQLPVKL